MFLVFPSLKFRNGHIIEAIISDDSTRHFYEELKKNPIAMCKLLRKENSKSLVVWDLDSYEGNDNTQNIKIILEMTKSIDIPIQLVSKFDKAQQIDFLLSNGISRVFVDELIIEQPDEILQLITRFSASRIGAIAIELDERLYQTQKLKNITVDYFVEQAKSLGINRLLYGDQEILSEKKSWDINSLILISKRLQMRITLIEGIRSSKVLRNMNLIRNYSIDSAMLGSALYENIFPCQKIWRMIESQLEV
jgi:phosphoribosylformimino-5-aminoimidazole carboxamide ribotide isomerase